MMVFNILKVGDLSLSNNDQSAAFSETYSRQTFHMKNSILKVFQIIFLMSDIFSPSISASSSREHL